MNAPERKTAKREKALALVTAAVFWIGLWALASRRVGSELLLPSPGNVLRALWALAGQAESWKNVGYTLGRMGASFLLGAGGGILVAAASAAAKPVKWIFDPMMKIIRATPVVSFIVLIWLWFRADWVPVVIGALMAAPVVWMATAQSMEAVDEKLLEMARAYRFTRWKTIRLIYLPSMAPAVMAACRTALGLSWKAGVAAEVLCRPKIAMGSQVYNAKLALESGELFAWTALVVACSFLVEGALGWLMNRVGRRAFPWS